jgi:nucleoside-diphosphate-sugar epimerase
MTHETIAVTGANGYVGRTIVRHLERAGFTVVKIDRHDADIKFSLGRNIDAAKLRNASTLVHCAYDFTATNWESVEKYNVEGSKKVLAAAKKAGARTIFISSMSAYEGCKSFYGRGKLAVEKSGLADVIIRPGLVYGPRSSSIVGKLEKLASLPVVPMITRIDQATYLCHQEDLGKLIVLLCKGKKTNGIIYAAAQKPVRLRSIIERFAGKKKVFIPVPYGLVLLGMRTVEVLGVRLPFRSDSLVSIAHQNPKVDVKSTRKLMKFREF